MFVDENSLVFAMICRVVVNRTHWCLAILWPAFLQLVVYHTVETNGMRIELYTTPSGRCRRALISCWEAQADQLAYDITTEPILV